MLLNRGETLMSEYILTSDGELMHYGVPGMKWGVRRATKRLSKATTKEQRDKAVGKLETHRAKASAKIEKLNKKRPKQLFQSFLFF